jgi:hypothetical protein
VCLPAHPERPHADAACRGSGVSAEKRAKLNSLGYLDYSPRRGTGGDGVVVHDSSRADAGWNLLTYHVLARAELVDANGETMHVWKRARSSDGGPRWARAVALPGGDLLVVTRPPGLFRIGRDGSVRWESDLAVHHDIEVLPNGNIVALTSSQRSFDGFSEPEVIDNGIAILSPSGELVEEKSLLDILSQSPGVFELRPPDAPRRPQRRALDVLHANRVDWLDTAVPGSPLFKPGTVLVTVRHQDSVVLVDWERNAAVWAWGRGTLGRPHDGTVLSNGHVLVFDNVGLSDSRSRVLEVDPTTNATVWSWVAPEGETLLSRTRGTVQRLANGNTLIGESNAGRAFEVTPDGTIVWEYRTPHRNASGRRAAFRIHRCPREEFAWAAPIHHAGHR